MREAIPRIPPLSAALALLAILGCAFSSARAAEKRHPVSEFFLGVVHHDAGVFGQNKEDGPDFNIEWRFDPFEDSALWVAILSPRPTLGANINAAGDTNAFYAALTWTFGLTDGLFLDWSMGGAVHDGKLSTSASDRKELGSRVLFYLAAGIGYRFLGNHGVSIRLDHISNATLADDNSGLDTFGVRYSYRF